MGKNEVLLLKMIMLSLLLSVSVSLLSSHYSVQEIPFPLKFDVDNVDLLANNKACVKAYFLPETFMI